MNIIKNCPGILRMTKLCDEQSNIYPAPRCSERADCIIKQAIGKLKMIQKAVNIDLLNEALDLFEIEEAE